MVSKGTVSDMKGWGAISFSSVQGCAEERASYSLCILHVVMLTLESVRIRMTERENRGDDVRESLDPGGGCFLQERVVEWEEWCFVPVLLPGLT